MVALLYHHSEHSRRLGAIASLHSYRRDELEVATFHDSSGLASQTPHDYLTLGVWGGSVRKYVALSAAISARKYEADLMHEIRPLFPAPNIAWNFSAFRWDVVFMLPKQHGNADAPSGPF